MQCCMFAHLHEQPFCAPSIVCLPSAFLHLITASPSYFMFSSPPSSLSLRLTCIALRVMLFRSPCPANPRHRVRSVPCSTCLTCPLSNKAPFADPLSHSSPWKLSETYFEIFWNLQNIYLTQFLEVDFSCSISISLSFKKRCRDASSQHGVPQKKDMLGCILVLLCHLSNCWPHILSDWMHPGTLQNHVLFGILFFLVCEFLSIRCYFFSFFIPLPLAFPSFMVLVLNTPRCARFLRHFPTPLPNWPCANQHFQPRQSKLVLHSSTLVCDNCISIGILSRVWSQGDQEGLNWSVVPETPAGTSDCTTVQNWSLDGQQQRQSHYATVWTRAQSETLGGADDVGSTVEQDRSHLAEQVESAGERVRSADETRSKSSIREAGRNDELHISWWRNSKISRVHEHQSALWWSEIGSSWETAGVRRWRERIIGRWCSQLRGQNVSSHDSCFEAECRDEHPFTTIFPATTPCWVVWQSCDSGGRVLGWHAQIEKCNRVCVSTHVDEVVLSRLLARRGVFVAFSPSPWV